MEPPLQLLSSPSSPCNALAKQTSARQNPMLLPEIITRVGQFLPLWSSNGFAREFNPLPLLHCALVSHTFRACLLPTLWYLYDGYSMRNIPQNILIKYSPLFRIISNTGPFKGPFLCKNLIELSTVYGQEWSRDLLVSNPGLKRLVWGGPFHRRIETLEQQQEWELELKALMGLENLDEFRTSGFSLGEGIFVKVLRNNAARLSNLVMSTVAGVTSIEGLELPHLSELQVTFGCPESPALVDLVRCCPRLQRLSLVGSKIKSFSPAPHHHHNNHHFQAAATNDQSDFEVLRLAKNIAECCPELSSIKFSTTTGLPPPSSLAHALRSHCFLNGAECAALVDATRRLEHFSADLLTLDFALTEALVGQRASLKSLKLSIHGGASATTSVGENDMYHATERIKEIHCLRRLKASLAALEELSLTLDYGPLPAIPAAATVLTPPPTTAFALASASTSLKSSCTKGNPFPLLVLCSHSRQLTHKTRSTGSKDGGANAVSHTLRRHREPP
ncbi:hypothetical protein BGZ51_007262 [Haplosporangium sp. Z 767]|nr:hypothetical protein BGZ50_008699 [Haplosporangium sp. Z 11]KAF9179080.1 hypothetical protein BGZ51_007262 [Haplosporangium sp. Z 767]